MANETQYISSVKIDAKSDGEAAVYQIKDAEARALLLRIYNDETDEIIIDCGGAPIDINE
jgi:hypothetical protein